MSLRKISRDEWPDGFTREQIAAIPVLQATLIEAMRMLHLAEMLEREVRFSLFLSAIAVCIALANAWFQLFT